MKTLNDYRNEFEEKFTFEMAPSIDPKAESPYNAPQKMLGKVISVADNAGNIPTGIKMPSVDELWNFILSMNRKILKGLKEEFEMKSAEYRGIDIVGKAMVEGFMMGRDACIDEIDSILGNKK